MPKPTEPRSDWEKFKRGELVLVSNGIKTWREKAPPEQLPN